MAYMKMRYRWYTLKSHDVSSQAYNIDIQMEDRKRKKEKKKK